MEKPWFIGRAALERTAKLPDHRRLVGFTMDGPDAPVEGSPIWSEGEIIGHVTGSWHSPALGRTVMLGWQKRTPFPDHVEIDGRDGQRDADAVLRPRGPSCPRLIGCEARAWSPTRPRSMRFVARASRRLRSRCGSRRTSCSSSASSGRDLRIRRCHAIVADEAGLGRRLVRDRCHRCPTSNGTSPRRARRSPRVRSPASRPRCGCPVDGEASSSSRPPPTPQRWRNGSGGAHERIHPDAAAHPLAGHGPKPAYDVVIIGGGGHGLSTAYYLATRHGITNVAVLEADYIASGNTGRNTTIIRANYGIPEAIRFYHHSQQMYAALEDETGASLMHQTRGILWCAHTEMAMRTERARCAMNQALGVETVMVTPAEIKSLVPQIDLAGAGRYPILGASHHLAARPPGTTASPGPTPAGRRSVESTSSSTRRSVALRTEGDRVVGVETAGGPISAGHGAVGDRRPGDQARGPGRTPPADPDPSAPRLRHQRLRPGPAHDRRQHGTRCATSRRPNAARC